MKSFREYPTKGEELFGRTFSMDEDDSETHKQQENASGSCSYSHGEFEDPLLSSCPTTTDDYFYWDDEFLVVENSKHFNEVDIQEALYILSKIHLRIFVTISTKTSAVLLII